MTNLATKTLGKLLTQFKVDVKNTIMTLLDVVLVVSLPTLNQIDECS